MEAGTTGNRLREGAIGLPQVLFQSITHMAPGAAIAFSIYLSIVYAGPALPLSVLLALIGWLAGGALAVAFAPRRILDNVANLFVGETPVGIAGPDVPPPLPSGAMAEPA
jgi:hypothetical protein